MVSSSYTPPILSFRLNLSNHHFSAPVSHNLRPDTRHSLDVPSVAVALRVQTMRGYTGCTWVDGVFHYARQVQWFGWTTSTG